MAQGLYIRPLGHVPPSAHGERAGVLTVAGRHDLAFCAAEIIERHGERTQRHVRWAAEIEGEAAGVAGLEPLLSRVRSVRPAVAGLSLDCPRIMGIINVTPDSFADGGRYLAAETAVEHGLRLEAEGADILDIGGESTRPGAEPVDVEEEWRRVEPVIAGLAKRARVPLSIDTRKAEIMRRAVSAGVRIINDISAFTHDGGSMQAAAASGLPGILMHSRGDPRTMQDRPSYADVVLDVYDALQTRIEACERAGLPRDRLIVDPGIGFGKTLAHNLALLANLAVFHGLGCALLLGASRKSFIGKLTGAAADERLPASIAAALAGVAQGVQILRVHDVAATRQALAVWQGAQTGKAPG